MYWPGMHSQTPEGSVRRRALAGQVRQASESGEVQARHEGWQAMGVQVPEEVRRVKPG